MISDFIGINKESNTPIYQQIYNTIKYSIENGNLKDNEKLPSVRKLCADLNVSKTTVETAYNLLRSEGYIINQPQKGYYVEKGLVFENKRKAQNDFGKMEKVYYKYDFSGKGIDKNCSNVKEWKKYVKDILNKEYLLNTYADNQGEAELREAIAKYAFATRGATADSKRIIIGSGSQTLIYILCGLLGTNKRAAIEENFFPQAEQVFKDFNYSLFYTSDNARECLLKNKPDILLINTNHKNRNDSELSVSQKLELIKACRELGCVIIEDDFNGELRYKTHSKACLQSYSPETTVYIGSFSKTLMPSVRISYMILPKTLALKYEKVKENYNQTTSKIEQLALARYINDLKLEKHLRKSRRYYKAKSEYTESVLKKHFKSFFLNETSMYFEIPVQIKDIKQKLNENDVNIMSTSTDEFIRINFSEIDTQLIEEGIRIIKEVCNS
ncbi:MAG: PLP-dependent aminotransferase family protein [Ruminococcus sp.]|nr:PLP-dependent aminotransferase family protein [Ruminococcus sp.]